MIVHHWANWKHWQIEVHTAEDIEEAIFRCGWTVLNCAEEDSITADERAIIAELGQRPYTESHYRGREWWDANAELVESGVLTPDV